MKQCTRCKNVKDDSDFYTRITGELVSWCKQCSCEYSSKYMKNRIAIDPVFKQRQLDLHKKYYKKRYHEDPALMLGKTYAYRTCKIIRDHHEEMKDDPEHLTTEFIQKIVGSKCDI